MHALAAGLAYAGDAVAMVADRVVEDFGHAGVANDAFGEDVDGVHFLAGKCCHVEKKELSFKKKFLLVVETKQNKNTCLLVVVVPKRLRCVKVPERLRCAKSNGIKAHQSS